MKEYIISSDDVKAIEEEFNINLSFDKDDELIRCKDCKWKQGSECVRFADVRPFPDDYCSRAKPKDNKK